MIVESSDPVANVVGSVLFTGKNLTAFMADSCSLKVAYTGYLTLISQIFEVRSLDPVRKIFGS
jgi:hypothetical protein